MGGYRARTKRTKNKKSHTRTIWTSVEREVKRKEIDPKNEQSAANATAAGEQSSGSSTSQQQPSTS